MAEEIANYSEAALKSLEQFRNKWLPLLHKHQQKIQTVETELIDVEDGNDNAMLSATGQYIIEENLQKLKKLLHDMLMEHRQIHTAISKCGKDLDRNFKVELKNLIKNEKEIEAHTPYFSHVNRLIFEHLMSLGRVEVAETFMKESELELNVPAKCDIDLMRSVMEPFQQRNYIPAIEWVMENSEDKLLLFRLHCQQVIQLITEEKRMEALSYVKQHLQPFGTIFGDEIRSIMTVIVNYPNVAEKHQKLFMESSWLELEEELSAALTKFKSPLSMLLDVGACAIPQLLKCQMVLKKEQQTWFGDELPIEIKIPEHVHSTFTCPILRTQTTKENPPMRLGCGHVISREALSRLSQGGRIDRLKCPYCPEESGISDAIEVHF